MLWWLHLVGTPFFLHGYYTGLASYSVWLRILLFPLNVWMVKIIEGYTTIFLFGRHVVWHYTDRDALFHGNIRLSSVFRHWLLGLVVELSYRPLLVPLAHLLGPFAFSLPLLLLPFMLYLSQPPYLNLDNLKQAGIKRSLQDFSENFSCPSDSS
eukprot:gb/GEZN01027870.1/.p1 GENE.gb/GEZN01027870.1/~~gb/GEZN01027870.1/.p1  ORF type:complete len:165 (-),score=5.83 gb/GEZN01027870.1/:1-462(-)